MERKIEMKDAFLEKMKKQYDTKQTDNDALKAKKIEMSDLNYTELPKKMTIMGQVGKTSVRKAKPEENQLHTGQGESFVGP